MLPAKGKKYTTSWITETNLTASGITFNYKFMNKNESLYREAFQNKCNVI